MRLQRLDIDAGFVDDRAVPLQNMRDQRAILFGQEFRRVIADIAKPLDNHPLAGQSRRHTGLRDISRMIKKGPQRILDPAACGLGPAGDPALGHWFAGHTGPGIDLGRVKPFIFIRHPGHLAFAGADIRGWYILRRVDEVAFGKLLGEAARDPFQFSRGPFTRVDDQPAFRPAERHLDQCTFVAHQRGQCLHLLLVDIGGVTDAALDRLEMFGMDRPVSGKGEQLVAQPHAKAHNIG